MLVIIPTYQEAANLAAIVRRTLPRSPTQRSWSWTTPAPTAPGIIAEELAAAHSSVHVLHRAGKAGLGAAYLAGFAWGLERGYDVLVEMDADGSHRPEQLDRLLVALRHADLVIGARWVPGGRSTNGRGRAGCSPAAATATSGLLLGLPLADATGGFRAFRASTLRALDLAGVASAGYCFQVDLAWRAVRAGLRVVEVPITFVERERGASKMSRAIVGEALWRVTVWGIQHRLARPGLARPVRGRKHSQAPGPIEPRPTEPRSTGPAPADPAVGNGRTAAPASSASPERRS